MGFFNNLKKRFKVDKIKKIVRKRIHKATSKPSLNLRKKAKKTAKKPSIKSKPSQTFAKPSERIPEEKSLVVVNELKGRVAFQEKEIGSLHTQMNKLQDQVGKLQDALIEEVVELRAKTKVSETFAKPSEKAEIRPEPSQDTKLKYKGLIDYLKGREASYQEIQSHFKLTKSRTYAWICEAIKDGVQIKKITKQDRTKKLVIEND